MALGAQVDTRRPLKVAKGGGEVTIVKNVGNPTIYYKSGQNAESVSSSVNDGSLAKGSSLTLSQTTDFIATEGAAQVEIATKPAPPQFSEELVTVVEAEMYNVKNPRWLGGAKGDGKADDTPAIQAAINAAKAAGGATLYFPAGTYNISELSVNFKGGADKPVNFMGAGRKAVTLVQASGSGAMLTLKNSSSTELEYNGSIKGMTFYGTTKTNPGILLEDVAWTVLDEVEVLLCSVGVEAKGVVTCEMHECFIKQNVRGVVLTKDTAATTGAPFNIFRNCVISSNTKVGAELDYAPGVIFDKCDMEFNGEEGKTTTGAIIIGAHQFTEPPGFAAGQVIIRDSWLESNNGRAVTCNSGALRMHDTISFATDINTVGTEGREVWCASGVERVVLADCEFPTTVGSSKQILIEGATCKGEIANCRLNQLYTVPAKVLVKQDNYYTSPLYFATANISSETALETQTGGLGLLAGNFQVFTAGKGLRVQEGANCKQGVSKLVAGKVEVANTSVTATSRIFVTAQEAVAGSLFVEQIKAGEKFTIKSTNAADTQNVAWQIFEVPA